MCLYIGTSQALMEQDLKTYLDRKQEGKIQKTLTKQCTFSCDTTLMALQLYVKHFLQADIFPRK